MVPTIKKPVIDIRDQCHFGISLRFELFFALHTLFNPHARIHLAWRDKALAEMPIAFLDLFKTLGGSCEIFPAIEGALPGNQPFFDFPQLLETLKAQNAQNLQRRILMGEIHVDEIVEQLVEGKTDLATALAKLPKVKHEWLSFIGIYPYDPTSPMIIGLELLLKDPEKFRQTTIDALEMFWQYSFKATWNSIQDQLQKSMEERSRLFQSCSFSEFAQQALLRLRIDEKNGTLEAIRGGFIVPFDDIESLYFFPSAFNDRRYWSSYRPDLKERATYCYFPYFDPAITLGAGASTVRTNEIVEPELDPALIFKALGDTTRYAIVSLLARQSLTAASIAKLLAVSKPTVSHHINQLREAGLINERYQSGAVQITLRREVFEKLSALTLSRLFENPLEAVLNLATTRKKNV
jgi:ArsR family transcriptional regulator